MADVLVIVRLFRLVQKLSQGLPYESKSTRARLRLYSSEGYFKNAHLIMPTSSTVSTYRHMVHVASAGATTVPEMPQTPSRLSRCHGSKRDRERQTRAPVSTTTHGAF